jgi:hypothetical protein
LAACAIALCLARPAAAQPTDQGPNQSLTVEVEGRVRVATEPGMTSPLTVTITNISDITLESGVACDAPPGWRAQPPTARVVLAPGERFVWPVTLTAPALDEGSSGRPQILVRVRAVPLDARGPARQAAAVTRRLPVPIDAVLGPVSDPTDGDSFLRLNGRSALRVDLERWTDRGPFTLEARVRATTPDGRSAVASNTQGSGFGIYWSVVPGSASLPAGYVHAAGHFVRVEADRPWDWARWTHLALVYDGQSLTFFVEGRPTERIAVLGLPDHNALPLMIGADVDDAGQAMSFFAGDLDDVRLSSVARYTEAFTPATEHGVDAHTLILLNFDEDPGAVFRNLATTNPQAGGHAWIIGSPEIVPESAD